jgi:hypothetical protein
MTSRSPGRPRLVAAMIPDVRPIRSSTKMAAAISCSVAGRREAISALTSVFWM